MNSPNSDKIAKLQRAIDEWGSGQSAPIIDEVEEQRLAPIKSRALALINHRARSEKELRNRLLDSDFEPELVDRVVDICLRNGMLDDRTFAFEWVRQRAVNQKKSIAVLRRELKAKGVADSVIEEALETVDTEDQSRIMEQLITKKAASIKTIPADRKEYDKFLKRIVGVAARRGFPEGQALRHARMALDNRIEQLQ